MRLSECHAGFAEAITSRLHQREKARREDCSGASVPPSLVVSYANPEKMKALKDLVGTLLTEHVIEPVPMQEKCLHNIVFLRPKPNGTWCLILDVSALNKFKLRVRNQCGLVRRLSSCART